VTRAGGERRPSPQDCAGGAVAGTRGFQMQPCVRHVQPFPHGLGGFSPASRGRKKKLLRYPAGERWSSIAWSACIGES